MEQEAIFVLFDLRGDFKEGEDDRRGLGLGQRGMVQGVGTESMVQGIGRTREHQPHRVGQEGGCRGPITVEVQFHGFDDVFAIATGTIEVFVEHLRGRSVQRRHNKAWVIARAHDFRLEHDPPGLCPGLCRIAELVVEAATDRSRLAMGLGEHASLVMQTTRRLDGGSGLAEQDGIPSQAKDKIGPSPMREHVDDLWSCKMTIPADEDVGVGPVTA